MIQINAKDSPLYVSSRIIDIPTDEQVAEALHKDATARRVLAKGITIENGQLVGTRLNLNVLKSTGVCVNTVHAPTNKDGYKKNRGWFNGQAQTYLPVVMLQNAYCNVHQAARDKIASGQASKHPMACLDGQAIIGEPIRTDGIELRFNPKRERFFVDANNHPVQFVEFATVVGHRVYARGIIRYYGSADEAPAKVGKAPCAVEFAAEQHTLQMKLAV